MHAFRAALLSALILVTLLTTVPVPSEVGGAVNDKLSHILAFFALALLADFSFAETRFNLTKAIVLFAYGAVIELVQHRLPYREFSLADLAANGTGIFIYWLSVPLLRHAPILKERWTRTGAAGESFR